MKQFNKTSAIRKIKFQKNKNTYIKRLSISLSCLILLFLVILFTFARFENSSEEYTMINGQIKNVCEYELGHEWTFDYTGDVQNFNAPCNGEYRIETWGAQGGYSSADTSDTRGGYGGYSSGTINLTTNNDLYVVVGGKGKSCTIYGTTTSGTKTCGDDGGYNGGGSTRQYVQNTYYGSGGGATHIATKTGLLSTLSSNPSSVLIVAGGGGGASRYQPSSISYNASGGDAGGYIGSVATYTKIDRNVSCTGGTQNSGGTGSDTSGQGFGHGGNLSSYVGPGGGAGYYGGGTSEVLSCGGSGYIGNSNLTNKQMVCYNCATSNDVNTKTISNTCHNTNPTADCSKEGNGYARITLVSTTDYVKVSCDSLIGKSWNFDYTGSEQEFNAPCNGNYKVELWGAQGGETSSSIPAGRGGYTSGTIILTKQNLYIYVGGEGSHNATVANAGGYNGGGYSGNNSDNNSYGGGGATDIRLIGGVWNNFDGLKSRIMVAAGGGGSLRSSAISAGAAGGLSGYVAVGTWTNNDPPGAGTQTTPGMAYLDKNGSFGYGIQTNTPGWGGGGGGGYYGGGTGYGHNGSGGSSFISGYTGCNAIAESSTESNIVHTNQPNHYSGKIFTNGVMIDGKGCNWSTGSATNCGSNQPQPDGTNAVGHSGNGYARITYISIN